MQETEEKKLILVVDDNEFYRTAATTILIEKYKVVTANSGIEAVELLMQDLNPDLILLDLVMPGMDGWAAYKRIKEIKPKVPVAFVSSVDGMSEICHSYNLGIDDFITKPYEMEDLLHRIEIIIENYEDTGEWKF